MSEIKKILVTPLSLRLSLSRLVLSLAINFFRRKLKSARPAAVKKVEEKKTRIEDREREREGGRKDLEKEGLRERESGKGRRTERE